MNLTFWKTAEGSLL